MCMRPGGRLQWGCTFRVGLPRSTTAPIYIYIYVYNFRWLLIYIYIYIHIHIQIGSEDDEESEGEEEEEEEEEAAPVRKRPGYFFVWLPTAYCLACLLLAAYCSQNPPATKKTTKYCLLAIAYCIYKTHQNPHPNRSHHQSQRRRPLERKVVSSLK